MQVGDLVRKLNPWTAYNPWMKFAPDDGEPGLVVAVDSKGALSPRHKGGKIVKVKWLWSKNTDWVVPKFLEKIEKE